ncbi:MAG: ABC transporter ATP-binding protein [Opitutales bacterium]
MTISGDSPPPLLRVQNLEHSFTVEEETVHALRGVSFEVKAGEVTAVVGPSGCGKSTLLYLLGLLDRPNRGEIFLDNESVAEASDEVRTALRNKRVGFVFQFHFLIKELTACENVSMPLLKAGFDQAKAIEKSKSILHELGLGEKANRFANKLSGGEQQRVAIARALVNSPSLLLADEPTGNLDSTNSEKVFNLLVQFARDQNIAVLLVTHNPELAKKCDHILRMIDGRLDNQVSRESLSTYFKLRAFRMTS